MSQIEELIKQYCPDGVRYFKLGEIGTISGGLSGKSKQDFKDGNARYVSYMNVYSNIATNVEPSDFVVITPSERQLRLTLGDVLFTGSSETPHECGMSSVLTAEPPQPLYLNSFCIAFRPNDAEMFIPEFLKHLFRSTHQRLQISRTANGVTRFNVSKSRLAKIMVPVPPIEVQKAIALILDLFQELDAALEAELEARTKQYEYYRDLFFSSTYSADTKFSTLGEIGSIFRGRRFVKDDIQESGIPAIHYGEVYTKYSISASQTFSFITPELASKLRSAQTGDVILVSAGETVDDIGKSVAWLGQENVIIHDALYGFRSDMNPKYVSYYFSSSHFRQQLRRHITTSKVSAISPSRLAGIRIPVPSREQQENVVEVLDRFEEIVNDLSTGIPGELMARRKQYEYYRDKLLTFEEAA